MKKYIKSNSPYYTTKRVNGFVIDEENRYHPHSSIKELKRVPGKEKSKSCKNLVKEDYDVIDSYTDEINAVYSELSSYRDSIVWPVAKYIENDLRSRGKPDHFVASDELRVVDKLIASVANLEILEDACEQFEEYTKCKLRSSVYGPDVSVRYDHFIGDVLSPSQIWIALSGEYSSKQIVDNIMLPKHKANIKKYGDPKEPLA